VDEVGYMLENPVYPVATLRDEPSRLTVVKVEIAEVTTLQVRTISRKDSAFENTKSRKQRILRDHTPTILHFLKSKMKRWSEPYGDVGRLTEMTSPPIDGRAFDRSK
jgi:hypothetical protein